MAQLESQEVASLIQVVAPATRRVTLRAIERGSGRPVAIKLHVHGAHGEYLAPVTRHRLPNPAWFEDYSVNFTHLDPPGLVFSGIYPFTAAAIIHPCTYVPAETTIDLPLGPVYVEASKGLRGAAGAQGP